MSCVHDATVCAIATMTRRQVIDRSTISTEKHAAHNMQQDVSQTLSAPYDELLDVSMRQFVVCCQRTDIARRLHPGHTGCQRLKVTRSVTRPTEIFKLKYIVNVGVLM